MNRTLLIAILTLAISGSVSAQFKADDFPPSTAKLGMVVKVGDTVTIGGPGCTNFLPNTTMTVYVAPHRTWREGDPLADKAVRSIQVKSDRDGTIPRTELWKTERNGQFDIIIDYDGNGRFSYALDALDSFGVVGDTVASACKP